MQEKNKEISIIKQRIIQYLDSKEISRYRCYADTGISNNVLSQPNGISEENLMKFLRIYEDINLEWLLLGEGSMLKEVKTENYLNQQKIEIQQSLPEITPDFLLKRYEELVIENSELKKKLTESKKNELSGLPAYSPITPLAEEPAQLIVDKMQTDIQK